MIDKLSKVGQEGRMLDTVWCGSREDGITDHTGTREGPLSVAGQGTRQFNNCEKNVEI